MINVKPKIGIDYDSLSDEEKKAFISRINKQPKACDWNISFEKNLTKLINEMSGKKGGKQQFANSVPFGRHSMTPEELKNRMYDEKGRAKK